MCINMKKIDFFEVIEMCITSKCNLQCTHCYQAVEKNRFQLSFEQIVSVIDYTKKYDCRKYVLSGGEFFMHPNAYEILDYIVKNTSAEITCVTNSTLIDVEKLHSIVPVSRITFKISVDGDETEHDKRRGSGMFKKVEEKINQLKKLGYIVDITMTLVEENIHCIPTVLNNIVFDKVTLMPVATTGAACEHFSTKEDSEIYKQVICHVYKTCREYVDGTHRCYIFPRCFSVKYDGSIYPCSLSRDYDIGCFGNINEKNIKTIIESFIESDESNMYFDYKNNNQIEKCNNCSQNTECTRGCRIRAYKWNGSLTTFDPFACKIFRDEFKDKTFGQIYWGSK